MNWGVAGGGGVCGREWTRYFFVAMLRYGAVLFLE